MLIANHKESIKKMKLYVGNLPNSLTEQELQELFLPYGEVKSVNVIKDRFTGEPRGFGFVEMLEKETAQNAIAALDGKEVKGRKIRVSEAQPRPERPAGRDGRGGGFNGRGNGGGDRGGFGGNRSSGPRRSSW
jgi:RNA recognition motif-containing protein